MAAFRPITVITLKITYGAMFEVLNFLIASFSVRESCCLYSSWCWKITRPKFPSLVECEQRRKTNSPRPALIPGRPAMTAHTALTAPALTPHFQDVCPRDSTRLAQGKHTTQSRRHGSSTGKHGAEGNPARRNLARVTCLYLRAMQHSVGGLRQQQ